MIISSLRNPRIVALRKLDRRRQRRLQGRFAAEGPQALHMALESGWKPLELYHCPALFRSPATQALLQRYGEAGAATVEVSEQVMRGLSERGEPRGLIATFPLPQATLADVNLPPCPLVLVLDRLADPGNLGTLLRTADAVGAAAVVLLPPCVDPLDPKVLRAGMGSFFNLPVVTVDSPESLFAWLERRGLALRGADAGGEPWTALDWRGGLALALGNEAHGLDAGLASHCAGLTSLPLHGRAESLNVAVAGGVLMYAWRAANPPGP